MLVSVLIFFALLARASLRFEDFAIGQGDVKSLPQSVPSFFDWRVYFFHLLELVDDDSLQRRFVVVFHHG